MYTLTQFKSKVSEIVQDVAGKIAGISGAITGISVAAGGTTYHVSDVLTLAGGTGGTARVTAVSGTGAVTAALLLTAGSGYSTTGAKATTVAPSGGSGCTITVVSVSEVDFIQEAVKIYSRHRPREVVKDITGDGTYNYSISTNLTSWVEDFSIIKSIEYPAGQRNPVYLDEDDYAILRTESGLFIRFFVDTPSASDTIRVTYTALHILSDSQNTIPQIDEDAVCNLAASLCSGALASYYAQTSDPTIGADSVNYRTKSQEYSARAKEQKKIYMDHLGLKDGDVAPASVRKVVDVTYPGGIDRLTHPRKWR
jgi:hypothetical protein